MRIVLFDFPVPHSNTLPLSLSLAPLFSLSLPSYAGQLDRKTYDMIPTAIKTWDNKLKFLELHHGYGLFRYSPLASTLVFLSLLSSGE